MLIPSGVFTVHTVISHRKCHEKPTTVVLILYFIIRVCFLWRLRYLFSITLLKRNSFAEREKGSLVGIREIIVGMNNDHLGTVNVRLLVFSCPRWLSLFSAFSLSRLVSSSTQRDAGFSQNQQT